MLTKYLSCARQSDECYEISKVTRYGPCSQRMSSPRGSEEYEEDDRVKRVEWTRRAYRKSDKRSQGGPHWGSGGGSVSKGWEVPNVKG